MIYVFGILPKYYHRQQCTNYNSSCLKKKYFLNDNFLIGNTKYIFCVKS